MRKYIFGILLLLITLVTTSFTNDKPNNEENVIVVKTLEGFLKNLGNDRTITIEEDIILKDLSLSESKYYKTYKGSYGDTTLQIRNVKNLKIEGKGKIINFISPSLFANVIEFSFCENIELRNLNIGHIPKVGYCRGYVLVFDMCRDFTIDSCILFGSGNVGLSGTVSNLQCTSTIIKECVFALELQGDNLNFVDSKIINNEFFSIRLQGSFHFKNCFISGNGGYDSKANYLFCGSGWIIIEDTKIIKNKYCFFANEDIDNDDITISRFKVKWIGENELKQNIFCRIHVGKD